VNLMVAGSQLTLANGFHTFYLQAFHLHAFHLHRSSAALLFLIFCNLFCSLARADTSASITLASATQSIYLGDSVILDIESTGLLDPLDVSALKERPDFLRETTGTRIAVIEDNVVEIAIRRMEFVPTKTGQLVFGPLTGETIKGLITSRSVSVSVQAALSTIWQPDKNDLQSEFIFSTTLPIVGEQVVLDIKLRHTHQIANELIKMSEFPDFDVLPVFEQRRTIEGDGQWRQIAWRFLLHPKRSGSIEIDPIQWTGTMIKSRTQRGEFVQTLSHPALQVRSAPADRPDWWLPATSVKLNDDWSKDVITLSAGDEIIRTITLTAESVLGNQLPDIAPYPTRALTSTLIRSTREHELINNHTVATAKFEFRMVAQSPIPVFLDTVRVPWWNVTTSTHEEAILPARRINVGLPDRADLLADLAMSQSSWSRFVLKFRSYARWQPIFIALSGVLIFLTLLPLLRDGVKHHCVMQRHRKSLRILERLRMSRNWAGLYNELNRQADTRHSIKTDSQEYKSLIQALQKILFANKDDIPKILLRKIHLPLSTRQFSKRQHHISSL